MLAGVVVIPEQQDSYIRLWLVLVVQADRVLYRDDRSTLQLGCQDRIKSVYDARVRWVNRWHSLNLPVDQFHADVGGQDSYLTHAVVLFCCEPVCLLR